MTREEARRWTINSFHSLDENLDECNECDEWSNRSILKLNAELTSEANLNFAKWTLITYKSRLNRQFDEALLLLSLLIKFHTEHCLTQCDAEICTLLIPIKAWATSSTGRYFFILACSFSSLALLQLIKPHNSLDEDSVNATLQQRDLKPATPAPQQITLLLKEKIRHLSDQFRNCRDLNILASGF